MTDLVARLRAAGCVFAEDEAALLLEAGGDLEANVRRREAGEPLEVILGWVAFGGLRVAIDPGVFVPRRRSEHLALEAVRHTGEPATVLDLCCGAGALGAVIADRRPGASVIGTDIDPVAVACARRTLPIVYLGDLFAGLPRDLLGSFDVVVANAPYVPSAEVALMPREAREHEPLASLDGGLDGVGLHRRIAGEVRDWLVPTGVVLIETSRAQSPLTAATLAAAGFTTTTSTKGAATVVVGAATAT